MDVSNNPETVSILYQFPVRAGLDGVVRGQVGSVTAFRNAITGSRAYRVTVGRELHGTHNRRALADGRKDA